MKREIPLVSVITAVRNGLPYLERSMNSVRSQTWAHREHIVIDGGSTDGTCQLLAARDQELAFWKSEPDRGIFDAMNKGLGQARGQLVCFLNADDELADASVLERVAEAWQRNPDVALIHGRVRILDPDDSFTVEIGGPVTWKRLSSGAVPIHQSVFARRDVLLAQGGYDLSWPYAGDVDFLCRCFQRGLPMTFLDQVVVVFRSGGTSSQLVGGLKTYFEIAHAVGHNLGLRAFRRCLFHQLWGFGRVLARSSGVLSWWRFLRGRLPPHARAE